MMAMPKPRLGVIGGLGPLASADFYRKLTQLTPAMNDQDHVPLVLFSLPNLPDRSEAILAGSDAVFEPLRAIVTSLNAIGVERIAIPCNTAHHWYERLSEGSAAEIVHIVDSVVEDIAGLSGCQSVTILATRGTLDSGFYQGRLRAAGHDIRTPRAPSFQESVDATIRLVKAGQVGEAAHSLEAALRTCQGEGIDATVLACTELSVLTELVVPTEIAVIDSNTALARACLRLLHAKATNSCS